MAKAASSGQARAYNAMSISCIDEQTLESINSEKFQNLINHPDDFKAKFVAWVNNGGELSVVLANAFTVGDIFRHRAEEGDRRLWLSDNTQNWFVKPNLKKVIPIRTDLCKLVEYALPKNMKDNPIQEATGNPGFMSKEEFFCVMYLLIFQPELGKQVLGFTLKKDKYYIFHVMVNGKKVAFSVYWDGGAWCFDACDFDRGRWSQGSVFISFATVKKLV